MSTSSVSTAAGPHFIAPGLPDNEAERLAVLKRYNVLDTEAESEYDDFTTLAAAICDVPISVISLIDESRQWFKSRHGIDATETPREQAFCAHAILRPDELMEVPDSAQDRRFAGNPLVTDGPKIRFYAGAPLLTSEGAAIGTICVIDQQPRRLSEQQRTALSALSRRVVGQLEARELVARLELQSLSDGLTGVWNRRAFDRRLREEWARHARLGQSLGLLMLDVDKFKAFNDSYGHPAGDQALKQVATIVQATLRDSDFFARYGGEEFAVILPHMTAEGSQLAAERLRKAVERADWPHRAVTLSVGVAALVPEGDMSRNALVARADRALYQAKAGGRNRSQRFEDWPAAEG